MSNEFVEFVGFVGLIEFIGFVGMKPGTVESQELVGFVEFVE